SHLCRAALSRIAQPLDPLESAPGLGQGSGTSAIIVAPPAPSLRLSPLWLVLLATIPVLVVGKLAHKWVEAKMETPTVVAMSFAIGGLLMLLIEWLRPNPTTERLEDMTLFQALLIGLTLVLAVLFPGTSRSAATIMP